MTSAFVAILACIAVAQPVGWRPDRYCGIFSVYTLAQLQGRDVGVDALVSPGYVSTLEGSRVSDLLLACDDFGLEVEAFRDMSTAHLRRLQPPAILHVRSSPSSLEPNHFVVFLGHVDGGYRIFNPPGAIRTVASSDLRHHWDGLAIVSRSGSGARSLFWRIETAPILVGGSFVFAYLTVGLVAPKSFRSTFRSQFAGGLLIFLAPALTALGYHAASPAGILRDDFGAAVLRARFSEIGVGMVGPAQLAGYLAEGAVLVDVRPSSHYDTAHIPGAINIPFTSGDTLPIELRDIDRDVTVIAYCDSRKCGYAHSFATTLLLHGFGRTLVLDGGWREYDKTR